MNPDFLAMLFTTPPAKSDAIVCLCGEDAEPRYRTAYHAFRMGLAPLVVLSGGLHEPPQFIDAMHSYRALLGSPYGISPDKMMMEGGSRNTREQAVNMIDLALDRGWSKLILVASAYHLPRAFLTFVQALIEEPAAERIRIIPVPAHSASWEEKPAGMDSTRRELLTHERSKITLYQAISHVASYEDGILYLSKHQPAPVV
jgi:uncharacterized SAM-binding protein YcdF (DUF218 family)